jgi:broad specificity phosphatase PhoE
MDIYFVRHGQTEWDEERRMQGQKDSELTAMGKEDSKYLARELSRTEFSQIYSSPLERAMDTARYIKMGRANEIIPLDSFKEMNLGEWEGMLDRDVKNQYPEEHFNFWNRPHLFKPQGGESFGEFRDRVEKGLYDLVDKAEGERIIVVTHTLVIKAILSIVHDYPVDEFWKAPVLKSTSLTLLRVGDGKMETILEGDISHLD